MMPMAAFIWIGLWAILGVALVLAKPSVRGRKIPFGLSRYQKGVNQDWLYGALIVKLPVSLYWTRRVYNPSWDTLTKGWMIGVMMIQVGRAPIYGVFTFQVRAIVAGQRIGKHTELLTPPRVEAA